MVIHRLTYQLLTEITDNFSKERELGEGASGKVFRGVMKNGEEIAVKLLYNRLGLNDQKFQNELNSLMMLKHSNTVRFVGYCNETDLVPVQYNGRVVLAEKTYRAVCLEYLHNGNLKRHLSDESCGLDWNTRYKIIKGICEGIKYIHKGLGNPIYHLDLKPENILLDNNMVPKLADFGLAKILGEDITRTTANSYGTSGYIPPEYIERNVISNKFDIFSLGVVMIKIVAGPMGYTKSIDMPDQDFIALVQGKWRNRLHAKWNGCFLEAYCQQVKRCIELALNCVEKDRNKRPDIVDIVKKLSETENLVDKLKLEQKDKGTSATSKDENFCHMFSAEEPSIDEVKSAFALFDRDDDGFIGAGDLQFALASLGIMEDAFSCHTMIVAAGGMNSNGRMSLDQFVQLLENGLMVRAETDRAGRSSVVAPGLSPTRLNPLLECPKASFGRACRWSIRQRLLRNELRVFYMYMLLVWLLCVCSCLKGLGDRMMDMIRKG